MYKNYFFDLYGVLVDIQIEEDKDEIWEKLALYYGYQGAHYSKEELKDKFEKYKKKLLKLKSNSEYPAFEIENIFFKLFKTKGIKPKKKYTKSAAKVFRMLSTEKISLTEEIKDLLKELKKNDKNLYLISNGEELFGTSELKLFGINDYFEDTFFASDIGVLIQDKGFYKKVIEKTDVKSKESVVISTNEKITLTSQEYGFETILCNEQNQQNQFYLNGTNKNVKDIKELLLK